ncbi:unnamed protein product [Pieris macdunnoughi]|uniref:Uncharacterized protein n=1 Tax=Pieris macdunnoughi TaxID=345717 RepID=A0A821SQD0_9NEOP|nr:unnamed protein product [Pieris macdunnoughi]
MGDAGMARLPPTEHPPLRNEAWGKPTVTKGSLTPALELPLTNGFSLHFFIWLGNWRFGPKDHVSDSKLTYLLYGNVPALGAG